tara:strand:+ start:44 stop:970 length:927 start_codon:yes stop_codon:yes gene_type:complete
MIYIATTTINKTTETLRKFDKSKNCKVIIALDKKSKKLNGLKNSLVLSTKYQEKKWPKLSKLVGWNCIQRRNFAILEAIDRGANKIALIDDDNIPLKNWFKINLLNNNSLVSEYTTNKEIFDPIGVTNHKNLWHRGMPLEYVNNRIYKKIKNNKQTKFDIQAGFWNGDPDIDAVCRMLYRPECSFKKSIFPFYSKKISPFNSQNTIIKREVFKDYFLFPHIGRMDDIWASFYVTSKKYKVVYVEPTVYQKRNVHNLIKDFKQEYIGYVNSSKLVSELKKNSENIYKFLPKESSKAFDEWKRIIQKYIS